MVCSGGLTMSYLWGILDVDPLLWAFFFVIKSFWIFSKENNKIIKCYEDPQFFLREKVSFRHFLFWYLLSCNIINYATVAETLKVLLVITLIVAIGSRIVNTRWPISKSPETRYLIRPLSINDTYIILW